MKWSAYAVEQEVNGRREVQLLVSAEVPTEDGPARTPLSVNLVLDRSASMTGAPLAAAVEAAGQIIDGCGPEDHVGLVLFDGVVEERVPVTRVDEAGGRSLREALRSVSPGRGTSLHQAVRTGASALARLLLPGRKPRLVLLTDGEPSVGPKSPAAFQALGEEVAAGGVALHALGLGAHYLPDILTALTQPSGTAFAHADGPEGLSAALGSIFALLQGEAAPDVCVRVEPHGLGALELRHKYPTHPGGDALNVKLGGLARGHARRALFVGRPDSSTWRFEVLGSSTEGGELRQSPVEVIRTWAETSEGRRLRSIGIELTLLKEEMRAWDMVLAHDPRAKNYLDVATACLQQLVLLDSPEIDRRRHLDRLADLRLAVERGEGDLQLLARRSRSASEHTHVSQIIHLPLDRSRRSSG
jgi:Ca-activated chloride channel homolog